MDIVESDRHVSTVSIAQELKIAQIAVWSHFNRAGYKTKFDVWVPHELTQKTPWTNFHLRIASESTKIDPFLKRLVTGDEKWIFYDNIK